MDYPSFITALHEACEDVLASYWDQYPEAPPLCGLHSETFDEPTATTDDLHAQFETLVTCYDTFLDVDSTPYRETWLDHIVYNPSWSDRLSMVVEDPPQTLILALGGALYLPTTGHIVVSTDILPRTTAGSRLASELCHAYQDTFASPTWTHPYLREGFEQALSIQGLSGLAASHAFDDLAHLARRQRAETLLSGVLAHGIRRGGISPATLRDLSVPEATIEKLLAHPLWRPLRRVNPRYRWKSIAVLPEYALFGSLLIVSESEGVTDPYARAFDGTHPWASLIGDIRQITPSLLWRLYSDYE